MADGVTGDGSLCISVVEGLSRLLVPPPGSEGRAISVPCDAEGSFGQQAMLTGSHPNRRNHFPASGAA
jgi:hypothetical protein